MRDRGAVASSLEAGLAAGFKAILRVKKSRVPDRIGGGMEAFAEVASI
jgi:hypothetical protein|tara:strand:- start:54 stop:197 length:144 start_codon:yes stop_codon:yes gene_type:complete